MPRDESPVPDDEEEEEYSVEKVVSISNHSGIRIWNRWLNLYKCIGIDQLFTYQLPMQKNRINESKYQVFDS